MSAYGGSSWNYLINITVASKGNGAHLLKVGSKRRRTQTDMMQGNIEEVI